VRALFRSIVEPVETLGDNPRAALEERGFLARPQFDTIQTRTYLKTPGLESLESLTEDDIERIDYALKIRADNPDRRLTVLDRLLAICGDPAAKVLYFGPSVLDAECMAFLLRSRGIAAAFVSGATREVTRRKLIADFKSGDVQVLCNCEVLTTGFDAPRVTHVIMARPTVSQVLYEQMVGRGLRGAKFGGTETCTIVDLEDHYRGERPTLGFQAFREVWRRGRRAVAPPVPQPD
jgi:superfamily II DNA or RNA helicase